MPKRKSNYIPSLVHQHIGTTLARLKHGDGKSAADSLRQAERLSLDFHERRAEIEADNRLTAEGKFDALRAAGKETLSKLEEWRRPLQDGLQRHETQLKNELRAAVVERPPSDVAARVEQIMLHAEIRRAASSLTAQQIEVLYRSGGSTVRRALESLPKIQLRSGSVIVEPFVTPEIVTELLHDAGREKAPEKTEMLDDLQQVRDVYEVVAASIEQEIKSAAPDAVEPAKPRIV